MNNVRCVFIHRKLRHIYVPEQIVAELVYALSAAHNNSCFVGKDKKKNANDVHCELYFYLFYGSDEFSPFSRILLKT